MDPLQRSGTAWRAGNGSVHIHVRIRCGVFLNCVDALLNRIALVESAVLMSSTLDERVVSEIQRITLSD